MSGRKIEPLNDQSLTCHVMLHQLAEQAENYDNFVGIGRRKDGGIRLWIHCKPDEEIDLLVKRLEMYLVRREVEDVMADYGMIEPEER